MPISPHTVLRESIDTGKPIDVAKYTAMIDALLAVPWTRAEITGAIYGQPEGRKWYVPENMSYGEKHTIIRIYRALGWTVEPYSEFAGRGVPPVPYLHFLLPRDP